MRRTLVGALILGITGGCNLARMTDNMTLGRITPSMMGLDDVEMVCGSGAALAPPVGSLGKDGNRADRALTLTYASAAMCADVQAWSAEIDKRAEIYAGRGPRAQDLLILEKRARRSSSARNYEAFKHLEAAFGKVGDGTCPALNLDKNEGFVYLMGLSSGLLAVLGDKAADNAVGVPGDVPISVERGSRCLDDDQFWGMPGAMRAAVWASVPGAQPEGEDFKAALAAAAEKGEAKGVVLARALQIQTLANTGDLDGVRAAVQAYSAYDRSGLDQDWSLLNAFAHRMIRHESDKIWVDATGHRTDDSALGSFPSSPGVEDDLGGLLDDLLPEDTGP